MKSLKYTILFSIFFLLFSQNSYAIIEPKNFPRDTNIISKPKLTDSQKLRRESKAILAAGGFFLIPTTLLGSTFMLSESVVTSSFVLAILKSAAFASLGMTVLALLTYLFVRRLSKKNYKNRGGKFFEKIFSIITIFIGLASFLSLFFFSLETLTGLELVLKGLNLLSGLLFTIGGFSLLKTNKKSTQN